MLSGWDQVVLEEIMYIFTDIKASWCDKQNRHCREFGVTSFGIFAKPFNSWVSALSSIKQDESTKVLRVPIRMRNTSKIPGMQQPFKSGLRVLLWGQHKRNAIYGRGRSGQSLKNGGRRVWETQVHTLATYCDSKKPHLSKSQYIQP